MSLQKSNTTFIEREPGGPILVAVKAGKKTWRRRAPGRRSGFVALLLLLGGVGVTAAGAADDTAVSEAIAKWVETRRAISREQQDWRLGRELLDDRLDIARRENQALAERTAQVREDLDKTRQSREELNAQIAALKSATADLEKGLAGIEARVRRLLVIVPPPLEEKVRPLSQRLPADPAATRLSMGERFQNAIGVLNELNKASREIIVTSAVRDLEDGRKAEVTVLYLGFAQAYYFNTTGGIAGWGVPGATAWAWTPSNQLVNVVADVVAMHRNERPAVYVGLPYRRP